MAEPPGEASQTTASSLSGGDATTGVSVLRGGAWTVVAFVLPQLFTLVLSIAAARYLGPRDMGRQSYIAFVSVTVATCLTLGLPIAVQRFVASTRGEGRTGQLRGLAAWAARRAVALATVSAVVVASMQFLTYPDLGTAWLLAGLVSAVAILHGLASSVLFGLQQFRLATVYGLAAGLVTVASTVTVLALGYGITAFFAAELAGGALSLVGTGLAARRALRRIAPAAEPLGDLRGQVLRFAGISSIGILIDVLLFKRSEFFFLQAFSSDREIAVFSIAFAAVAAASRLPDSIIAVVMPAVSTLSGAGQGTRIASGYVRAGRLMLLLALPVAALSIALGPTAVRIAYGAEYDRVGTVLVALAPVPLIIGPLGGVAWATLSGLGRQIPPLLCSAAGLGVNLLLAIVLIPRFDALGAAFASSGGQLVTGLLLMHFAARAIGVSRLIPGAARTALAALVTGGVAAAAAVLLDDVLALVVGLPCAFAAFVVACRLLRVLTTEDVELLQGAVGTRLPMLRRLVGAMGADS